MLGAPKTYPPKSFIKTHVPDAVFYVQKSTNFNTVVYRPNLVENKKKECMTMIDPTTPFIIRWLMIEKNDDGDGGEFTWKIQKLTSMEESMAFGVTIISAANDGQSVTFALNALPTHHIKMQIIDSSSCVCYYNGKKKYDEEERELSMIYVHMRMVLFYPKVDAVDVKMLRRGDEEGGGRNVMITKRVYNGGGGDDDDDDGGGEKKKRKMMKE